MYQSDQSIESIHGNPVLLLSDPGVRGGAGAARGGGPDDVVQGALAGVPGPLEEEPDQVPTAVPTHLLRQARATAALEEADGPPGRSRIGLSLGVSRRI